MPVNDDFGVLGSGGRQIPERDVLYRKASIAADCVEVALVPSSTGSVGEVWIRDSKDPSGQKIVTSYELFRKLEATPEVGLYEEGGFALEVRRLGDGGVSLADASVELRYFAREWQVFAEGCRAGHFTRERYGIAA